MNWLLGWLRFITLHPRSASRVIWRSKTNCYRLTHTTPYISDDEVLYRMHFCELKRWHRGDHVFCVFGETVRRSS